METRRWINGAEKAGWRVERIAALAVHLRCDKTGCPGRLHLPLDNLGPLPEPCQAPHVASFGRAAFGSYEVMVDELRRRRRSLGLDQSDVTNAMGMAEGYVAKLESFARVASPATLFLWAETVGVTFTTTPAPLPPATIRAIENRRVNPYDEAKAPPRQNLLKLESPHAKDC
jgi:transcriptional regulator with XRE-family HTH domain